MRLFLLDELYTTSKLWTINYIRAFVMDHDPSHGTGPEGMKISRVEPGRLRRCSEPHGSSWATLARPDPRGLTRSVKNPEKHASATGRAGLFPKYVFIKYVRCGE